MAGDAGRLGPYELRGELGRGAMARVWRAWDSNLEREVAIKEPLFDPNLSETVLEEMGRRFVQEAKAAARLIHPGIVTIYAADVYDGRPAIVMELVEGATLADLLESGPLPPDAALMALNQLLDAVGYAHENGVVHRDIKPDNIFVSSEGQVKLADFGIAHVENDQAVRATVVGTVLGTPGYMSPEQATGAPVDARSDIFSVGTVAYEMFTGRNPFGVGDGSDSTTLIYRIVHEPAPALPDAVCAGLPVDVRPAIMAALSKDPRYRPQNAAAFKQMLHSGQAPYIQPAAMPVAPQTTAASPMKVTLNKESRKWLPYVAVAAACVIVLIVLLAGALSSGGGGMARSGAATPSASASAGSSQTEAGESPQASQSSQAPQSSQASSTASSTAPATGGDYIIADSATRYLSRDELKNYSSDDLCRAQNEIWARHGRKFKNNWLQSYFNSKSWYHGTINPDDFNSVYQGTEIEEKNAQMMMDELTNRGWILNDVHPN